MNGMVVHSHPHKQLSELNSILVYNIAALSYQLQNYGQALLYLKLLMENLEQVEEFIQVKSLFLMLQVLFELKMKYAAQPVIDILEVKLLEIERLIEKKKLIKNHWGVTSSSSAGLSTEALSKHSEKEKEEKPQSDPKAEQSQSEESKSWTTTGSVYECLDESITSKNSFCIIIGSFIRRNAVSPKTANLAEYQMMLHSYKAMFNMINATEKTSKEDEALIKQAIEHRKRFNSDIVNFKEEINVPAVAQHLGMLSHLKGWFNARNNYVHACADSLWKEDKDKTSESRTHPSCVTTPRPADPQQPDAVYQKCVQTHPAFYFNNLGLLHLRLRKYAMATFYLSKALKFTERTFEKQMAHPQITKSTKLNPNEHVNNQATQKTQEILFNYGLGLFKSKKYYQAYKCFERVSLGVCAQNPKLWYHMGLCAIELNKEQQEKDNASSRALQSDVYAEKLGYGLPNYVRRHDQQKLKRFILAPRGDQVT